MSACIVLRTLVCQVTREDLGTDRTYIKVNDRQAWGQHRMDNGDTRHILESGSDEYISVRVDLDDEVEIAVYEYDRTGDHRLGVWRTANLSLGDYVATFREDGAFYTLFFSVEDDNAPAELEIARPSIGQPMICKPSDLMSIRATIATRSVLGDVSQAIQQMETSIFLEDAETGARWPCHTTVIDSSQITQRRRRFRALRKELNDKQDRFPRSNSAFRAGCGIVSDFDVSVRPDVGDYEQLANNQAWPRMFNLVLGDNASHHCLFASDTWTDGHTFKFLHVTDSHVSCIFDTIAQQIREFPDIDEQDRAYMLRMYRNPNDHLRAIIDYANEQAIDFMVITGDLVNWCSDGFLEIKPREETNYRKFVEIITGRDGLGNRLRCPIFAVPGNHEYYPFAMPLRARANLYGVYTKEIEDELKAINLSGHTSTLEDMDHFYGSHLYAWHLFDPSSLYAFFVNTYPQFYQYLAEISYDVSYATDAGQNQLVLLNTGQDIGRLSKLEFLERLGEDSDIEFIERNFGTYLDYLQGGSHCVGFSLEDVRLLRNVMKDQSNESGLVLIFTHAPLVNLESNPGISKGLQRVYEHNHENTSPPPPDNDITRFLMSLEPGDVEFSPGGMLPGTTLAARGFPQGGTRHFYEFPAGWSVGDRDELVDYGCADGGGFKDIIQLVTGTDPDLHGHFWNNVIVFSGHTHAIHEYRLNRSGELGHEGPRVYAENYSGSTGFSQLPTGHKPDQLPRNQGDIAAWRRKNAPLLLISGALKKKASPMFREVHVTGVGLSAAIESMKMKMIPRFVPGEYEEREEEQELDWLLTLLNVMMR